MKRYLSALLMIAFGTVCLAIGLSIGGDNQVALGLGFLGGLVGMFGLIGLARAARSTA